MVDYKGQALAEKLLVVCFVVICTPAWIYGYVQQDFSYPFRAWVAATAVSALVRPDPIAALSLSHALWLTEAGCAAKLGNLQSQPDQVAVERHVCGEEG